MTKIAVPTGRRSKSVLALALASLILTLHFNAPAAADTYQDALAAKEIGDYTTALRLFRSLAQKGSANAQAQVGLMYTNGEGVDKDETEATRWFRLSAEQGNAFAEAALGLNYARGVGVPQGLYSSS